MKKFAGCGIIAVFMLAPATWTYAGDLETAGLPGSNCPGVTDSAENLKLCATLRRAGATIMSGREPGVYPERSEETVRLTAMEEWRGTIEEVSSVTFLGSDSAQGVVRTDNYYLHYFKKGGSHAW